MPAPVSQPDDPALLRIEGPIATITLNRPAAFNSINLAIAQKLEQLAATIGAFQPPAATRWCSRSSVPEPTPPRGGSGPLAALEELARAENENVF